MSVIIVQLVISFFLGIFLGILYFGGLWVTVKQLAETNRPALMFVSSFLIRILIFTAGFYYAVTTGILQALICILSFIITRKVFLKYRGIGKSNY